jgi:hypothetical protein
MTQFIGNEFAKITAKCAAREAELKDELQQAIYDNIELQAELKALREQVPVTYRYKFQSQYEGQYVWRDSTDQYNGNKCIESQPLYAAPVSPVLRDLSDEEILKAWSNALEEIKPKFPSITLSDRKLITARAIIKAVRGAA